MRTVGSVQVCAEVHQPWSVRWLPGPSAMFHFLQSGGGWLRVPGRAPLRLGAGDLVLLAPYVEHVVSDTVDRVPRYDLTPVDRPGAAYLKGKPGRDGPADVLVCGAFYFGQPVDHPLLTLLPPVVHVPAGTDPALLSLAGMLRVAAAESVGGRPGSDLLLRGLSEVLFVSLLRAWDDHQADSDRRRGWLAAATDPQIGAALVAVHADPGHPWTVEELGRRAAMSRSAFVPRFAALVGEPPMQYVTRWRILRAAQLLGDGDDTVGMVARRVGYDSEASFSRAFKRLTGTAPGAWRRGARPGRAA
jgi:AraC-like DNA-binding protein